MMKSKLSLKKLAKLVLFNFFLITTILGCSPIRPTYDEKELPLAIVKTFKKEFNLDIKSVIVGKTLWVYLPLDNLFIKSDKKNLIKYDVSSDTTTRYIDNTFKSKFSISELDRPKELPQEIEFDKDAIKKIRNILTVVALKYLSSSSNNIDFIRLVYADVKTGIEMIETDYALDLKKVYHGVIPQDEYNRRIVQDFNQNFDIIDDYQGRHLEYQSLEMPEFISKQITQRIRSYFSKYAPGQKQKNIIKEIEKIILDTTRIYNFTDYSYVELNDLLTGNVITLSPKSLEEDILLR
ncbi:MAG: hypothetical protein AB1472_01830 [Candidatus Omnitrophota bacterium]